MVIAILKKMRKTRRMLDLKIKRNKDYPYYEAIKIAIIYGLLGIAWIAFPDEWLSRLANNSTNFKQLNIYKSCA